MDRLSLISVFFVFLFSLFAHADYQCDSRYYGVAVFADRLNEKEILSVHVRAGTIVKRINAGAHIENVFWNPEAIDEAKMELVDHHFVGKFQTAGMRGASPDGSAMLNFGPVLQYAIVFKDGSRATTEAQRAPVLTYYGPSQLNTDLQAAINAWKALKDTTMPAIFEFHFGPGCQD